MRDSDISHGKSIASALILTAPNSSAKRSPTSIEGGFKNWSYELVNREFSDNAVLASETNGIPPKGKILVKDCICDAFLQEILIRPSEYDVVATMNLNGDYISDALAACVGGIGIAPGANINYETGHAIFEATHGTAPKYANLDKVNPGSLILSGAMMLKYMGWNEAHNLVEKGIVAAVVLPYFSMLIANLL